MPRRRDIPENLSPAAWMAGMERQGALCLVISDQLRDALKAEGYEVP